jgi:hypothetical protein
MSVIQDKRMCCNVCDDIETITPKDEQQFINPQCCGQAMEVWDPSLLWDVDCDSYPENFGEVA